MGLGLNKQNLRTLFAAFDVVPSHTQMKAFLARHAVRDSSDSWSIETIAQALRATFLRSSGRNQGAYVRHGCITVSFACPERDLQKRPYNFDSRGKVVSDLMPQHLDDEAQYGRNWAIFVTVSFKAYYRIYYWSEADKAPKELQFGNPGSLKNGLDRIADSLGYNTWFEEVWSFKLPMRQFFKMRGNRDLFFSNQ